MAYLSSNANVEFTGFHSISKIEKHFEKEDENERTMETGHGITLSTITSENSSEKNGYGTNYLSHSTHNPENSTSEKSLTREYNSVLDEKIPVPGVEDYSFSWRKLWAFSGPGFLMSIAYLDPGNIEADLKSASLAKFSLLWIVMWATVLGLFVQRLASRVGAVTGEDLAETCRKRFSVFPRYLLWIMLEVTIIAADMQEVIGTAIALYLLSNKYIPLYAGVLLTIADTFTFLLIDKYGLRKLEALFAFLIAVMAVTFGYEYSVVAPDQLEVQRGLWIPGCGDCSNSILLQAVGTVGALITPHNLYLHSALVKSRNINRKNRNEVSDANRYYFIESAIALLIALVINVFVVGVFAKGMFQKTNNEVLSLCTEMGINVTDVFDANDDFISGDMYKGGIFLGCQFGKAYMYIWACGLLAAGQSSTMSGTYTGQFVMEGFLKMKWCRWKRVLVTRTLAIMPTIAMALFQDVNHVSGMNDFLNALMSLQLPYALLVTFVFSASTVLMGEFANDRKNNVFMGMMTCAMVVLNLYFISNFVLQNFPGTWWVYALFGVFLFFYLSILLFLTLCLLVVLGCHQLVKLPIIGIYLEEKYELKESDKLLNSIESLNK